VAPQNENPRTAMNDPTHESSRTDDASKSFTSWAFCGRLAAPDFVMKAIGLFGGQRSGSSIWVSYITGFTLSDWKSKMMHRMSA